MPAGSLVPWIAIWPSPPANSVRTSAVTGQADGEHAVARCRVAYARSSGIGEVEGAGRRRVLAACRSRRRPSSSHDAVVQQPELVLGEADAIWYSSGFDTVTSLALIHAVALFGRVGQVDVQPVLVLVEREQACAAACTRSSGSASALGARSRWAAS